MNPFESVQVNKRITGTVSKRLTPGWWIVKDSQNKKYRAASSSSDIKIGQKVAVVGGQIVGIAGKEATPETYYV